MPVAEAEQVRAHYDRAQKLRSIETRPTGDTVASHCALSYGGKIVPRLSSVANQCITIKISGICPRLAIDRSQVLVPLDINA